MFAAIVQTKVELLTKNIDPFLLSNLIELRKSLSPALAEEIMTLDAFKDIKQHMLSTASTESQMTVKYLKDMSKMQAIVSPVRKGGLKRLFSPERESVKSMFAFDHINYDGYIAYQHAYLNNLLRKGNSIVKD